MSKAKKSKGEAQEPTVEAQAAGEAQVGAHCDEPGCAAPATVTVLGRPRCQAHSLTALPGAEKGGKGQSSLATTHASRMPALIKRFLDERQLTLLEVRASKTLRGELLTALKGWGWTTKATNEERLLYARLTELIRDGLPKYLEPAAK